MSWRVMGASYYPFGFVNPPDHLTVENDTTHETVRYVPERTCKFEVETDAQGFPKNHVCTNCREPTTGYGHIDWSYCPNCGAKVVGE